MALLTPTVLAPITGVLSAPVAVSASDTITPNGGYRYVLVVINGNASPDSVVISSVNGVDVFGRAIPTQTISVANATTRYISLANQANLADASTGLITITHSVTATVTCLVLAIPN